MKILFRTLIFHFLCILIFFIIYWNLGVGEHFMIDKQDPPAQIIDFFLLSTTIQAGVGVADIYPISTYGKISIILQQLLMISSNVLTLYLLII